MLLIGLAHVAGAYPTAIFSSLFCPVQAAVWPLTSTAVPFPSSVTASLHLTLCVAGPKRDMYTFPFLPAGISQLWGRGRGRHLGDCFSCFRLTGFTRLTAVAAVTGHGFERFAACDFPSLY